MRSLWTSVALSLLAALAHAQDAPIRVRYRSADTVYLDAGRAAGLSEGARLNVVASGEVVAELEVTFVAERSASCRVISEKGKVVPGQRVVRVGTPPPAETEGRPAPAPAPSPEPPAPAFLAKAATRGGRPWGRARGGVSAGWMRFWDAAAAPRDHEERTGRVDLDLSELAGQPVGFRLRVRLRDDVRQRVSGFNLPARARDDRLYEAALRYEPPSGRLRAEAGRLGGGMPFSIGIMDGALAELRVAPSLYVGGVAGRGADAGWLGGGSSANRFGAFVRVTPSGGALREGLAAVLRDGDRDRAAVESRLGRGGLRFIERIQVERAGGTTRVTDVFATVSHRASPSTTLSVSYDRQRTLALSEGIVPLDQTLREALRQGLRASIDVQTPGALGAYASGGLRLEEGGTEPAWSASGGLRHAHALGVSTSADASYYVNRLTRGVLATARAGHLIRDRHSIDFSYVHSLSTARTAPAGWRSQQWLRLDAMALLGRGAFVRLDVEYARGDDLQGPRAGLETGYRF